MKFTFITVSAPALKSLMKAAKEIMSFEEGLLSCAFTMQSQSMAKKRPTGSYPI